VIRVATASEKTSAGRNSARFGAPLRVSMFRNLLVADFVSDIGTFMQNVGAAWLMLSLGAGPGYVALTQTAASLPYFLLALPAGSAGDIFDRRKLVLYTEAWMMAVTLILAVLTISGFMTPWLLLGLTFALSAGDAFETLTWRAILPEVVSKDDLAAASALNGIEFNLARAVGPALAGLVIAAAGVATTFVVNFLSFFGVILAVARWKRPTRKQTAPPETLSGATVAAIRYVRNSPRDSHSVASDWCCFVLFQFAFCATTIGGQKRRQEGHWVWIVIGVLRGRCDRRCPNHASAASTFVDGDDCLRRRCNLGHCDRNDASFA